MGTTIATAVSAFTNGHRHDAAHRTTGKVKYRSA